MKVFLTGIATYPNFAPAWAEAFDRLGHTCVFLDIAQYLPATVIGRLQQRIAFGPHIWRLNQIVKRQLETVRPDIALFHNPNLIYPSTVAQASRMATTVCYHHDDPYGRFGGTPSFRLFHKALRRYDGHIVVRDKNLCDYQNSGISTIQVVRRYYVPWLHYRQPSAEWETEILFVGHIENDGRIETLKACHEQGLPLTIYGSSEWSSVIRNGTQPTRAVFGASYRQSLSSASICLAFHSGGNNDLDSYRVYEIPACGSFLLAQRTPLMLELYEEGKEAEFFSCAEELVDKSRFYLKNRAVRQGIARRGHERCVSSGYDILSRVRAWVDALEQLS